MKSSINRLVGAVSHHEREIEELRSDRELAIEYLKVALESLNNPDERGGSLLMLRSLAEACGGLATVAAQAGISREHLSRSLSPYPSSVSLRSASRRDRSGRRSPGSAIRWL